MNQIERIGVSVDKDLLKKFDTFINKQGYPNRSEAIRDLIRGALSADQLKIPKAKAVAAVFIVYDHHAAKLGEKLISLQHSHVLKTISSLHIHLDGHNCLEIIVLRGRVDEINKMADNIISLKGVKLGKVNVIATE